MLTYIMWLNLLILNYRLYIISRQGGVCMWNRKVSSGTTIGVIVGLIVILFLILWFINN